MPTIDGCIECTHIKIQNTGGPDSEAVRNRNVYFSLNVQVVYGPSMEFFDIVVRWPGSYHDSFIFSGSYANQYFADSTHNVILLEDGGYACKPYLFTPLRNPITPAEQKYNKSHIRTRNIIERAFGLWKRKFPCLRRGLANAHNTMVNIILSCALLYNLSRQFNQNNTDSDDPKDHLEEEEPHEIINEIDNNVLGPIARRAFIIRHFMTKHYINQVTFINCLHTI
ncbi:putative nuclease HARBI1 [Acyrthosiphon pisum]|uniref:DDE Tnp4 domain-containing protein n=1 Tax=Acyrthosiphon pisum TaxID=7029 RepID=A0A8R2B588_ACYPI|nr:putative nuclease HARBI1 [Acyrthosiphon pisum]|eukprot:XP_008182496.1 PREDICTED: putative nuclease HARBI1 [Acyrthosiphon pisum]